MHATRHVRPASILFALSLLLVAGAFIYAASQIKIEDSNLAYDWKIIWQSIRNGNIQYGDGLYNPPWGLLFILPLSFLPLQTGWGIWIFLTMAVLVFSVPTDPKYPFWGRLLVIFALVMAYPTLRLYADANVDALIVVGIWLLVSGYRQQNSWLLALGALITTLKPQAASLLLLMLAYAGWHDLPRQVWLRAAMLIGAVVFFSLLWWGPAWFDANFVSGLPQENGISLPALLNKWNLPPVAILMTQLVVAVLTLSIVMQAQPIFSPINTALLISASLLVSPYANAHSLILVLAFGLALLLLEHPAWGILLLLLYDAPFLSLFAGLPVYQAALSSYWTLVLCLTCLSLCWLARPASDLPEIRH